MSTLFKARLRLHFYLLFRGMWKGECAFEGQREGKTVYIAATTGSIWNNTVKPTKVFLDLTKP